jgi:16S rRNA (adenine1518-N6/adenine1519-N6)-dimethyltransferase
MSGFRPRKRFGQNFLHDQSVIAHLVAVIAPQPNDALVEIGPGLGALTCPLLERSAVLDVIELDRDLLAPLQQRCAGLGELRIHAADALSFDFTRLAPPGTRLRIVGNLPYNISTPLLFHLLAQAEVVRDMHFMLQKEVVDRLAAVPGTADYGRLSVMVQYRCAVTPLFSIGPGAFTPAPKVDSAVVRLVPHAVPPVAVRDIHVFERVVKQAFAQRRKTLHNNLKGVLDDAQLHSAGIDPGLRAERLTLAQFAALSNMVDSTDVGPQDGRGPDV